jgi:pimeloyl-ACP methyl ester carboxylesterase
VVAAMRGASRSDLPPRSRLEELKTPALILAWNDDPSHPLSTAERLADSLPAATLHEATTAEDVERWPDLVHEFLTGATVDPDREKRT